MGMLSVTNFFSQALTDDPVVQKLLEAAPASIDRDTLSLHCRDKATLQAVRGQIAVICQKVVGLGVAEIRLFCGNQLRNSFNPQTLCQWTGGYTLPLLGQLPDSGAVAIIRMTDNKGLYITEDLAKSDRAHPNNWTGASIDAFNIPEHFDRYISALMHYQHLSHYELVCLDGAGNKQQQIINAWLTQWRGDLVRVVEVLKKEYI